MTFFAREPVRNVMASSQALGQMEGNECQNYPPSNEISVSCLLFHSVLHHLKVFFSTKVTFLLEPLFLSLVSFPPLPAHVFAPYPKNILRSLPPDAPCHVSRCRPFPSDGWTKRRATYPLSPHTYSWVREPSPQSARDIIAVIVIEPSR